MRAYLFVGPPVVVNVRGDLWSVRAEQQVAIGNLYERRVVGVHFHQIPRRQRRAADGFDSPLLAHQGLDLLQRTGAMLIAIQFQHRGQNSAVDVQSFVVLQLEQAADQ